MMCPDPQHLNFFLVGALGGFLSAWALFWLFVLFVWRMLPAVGRAFLSAIDRVW